MDDISRILRAVQRGESDGTERLLASLYEELRNLAAQKLAREKPGQTLSPTALVHEAYMRLIGNQQFENRGHFFAAAATAMRRILIENARRKKRLRHGGEQKRIELLDIAGPTPDEELLSLDESLSRLAKEDPIAAQVVEMHHFAGLSHQQVADALGETVYFVRNKWSFARAWLKVDLAEN